MDFGYSYFELTKFANYLTYFHAILLMITTPLFGLELYVILTRTPKEFGYIRYFILNIAITNYLLAIVYFLWQPVGLFPVVGGYSMGLFKYLGPEGAYLGFELCTILIENQIVSYSYIMWYQYSIMKGRGRLAEFMQNPKYFIGTYLGYMASAIVTTITLLVLARTPKEEVLAYFLRKDYAMYTFIREVFINQPSTVAHLIDSNLCMILYVSITIVCVLCALLGIILFNVLLIRLIRSTKDLVTQKTLKLQRTFYYSMLAESVFVICFCLTPFIMTCMVILSAIDNTKFGIVIFNMPPISAPLSYVLVMSLVKPYRNFFIQIFKNIKSGRIMDSGTSSEQNPHVVET